MKTKPPPRVRFSRRRFSPPPCTYIHTCTFRHALRTLIRSPGYALTVVLSLTLPLGIGGTTAVFSVFRSVSWLWY